MYARARLAENRSRDCASETSPHADTGSVNARPARMSNAVAPMTDRHAKPLIGKRPIIHHPGPPAGLEWAVIGLRKPTRRTAASKRGSSRIASHAVSTFRNTNWRDRRSRVKVAERLLPVPSCTERGQSPAVRHAPSSRGPRRLEFNWTAALSTSRRPSARVSNTSSRSSSPAASCARRAQRNVVEPALRASDFGQPNSAAAVNSS